MNIGKDLVAASATPLVLAILAEGDSYGYAIIRRVGELSGGELRWTDGMLYPVLHRLERFGYVEARWAIAETGRRRRYYRITAAGREQLASQQRQWRVVRAALEDIGLKRVPATVGWDGAPASRPFCDQGSVFDSRHAAGSLDGRREVRYRGWFRATARCRPGDRRSDRAMPVWRAALLASV